MTTTADAMRLSALVELAEEARLETAVARMVSDEPTLSDISAVLYLLARADQVDGVRVQSLCHLASRALGKFDADTRCAPPAELAEVVRDARQSCGAAHLGCANYVLSWIFDGTYCSPTCQVDDMRATGETWVG